MNRFGMYLIASVMLLVASCAGSTPPQAQSSPAPTDGTQKAGPAPRTPGGHPDFTGVWFPGVVPDIDRYGVTVADHRTFDPKVTPQEPPSFQPWALQKIKLMGDLDLISPGLQCWPGGATAFGLGQVNAIGFGLLRNIYDFNQGKALSGYDVRNSFTANYLYELPFAGSAGFPSRMS